MEMTINPIVLILLSVILFACGFMIRGRIRRTLKLNSIPRDKSGRIPQEPMFLICNAEYAGIDEFNRSIVKYTACVSYYDDNDKLHSMEFIFYTHGPEYSIGDKLYLSKK